MVVDVVVCCLYLTTIEYGNSNNVILMRRMVMDLLT